ncbi:MAG: alpha/beta hydrolase [Chloroflexi bacterium]|nr:alpha/beta hydrolase [Chloroflexota bacterium]
MPFVQAGDVRLEYFEAGEGDRTMVLVHGASSSSRAWAGVQRALAEAGVRSLAISTRGAGGSDRAATLDGYTPESYARDLAAAVDALGLGRFVLVGHSLGTLVSRYYVRDHADRVRALVLISGPDPGTGPRTPEQLAARQASPAAQRPADGRPGAAWLHHHAGLSEAEREALWGDLEQNPPERAQGQAPPWPGLDGLAAQMPVDTLVVLGDQDETVAPSTPLRGFLELPVERRSLHVFHGVGHYPPAQVPERLTGVLLRFTKEHAGW